MLASVASLANARKIVWLAVAMPMGGTVLMANGFYLFVNLPF